jgi:hypothetical protein
MDNLGMASIFVKLFFDMNSAENIGAIIKDKVEELMASEDRRNRYNYDVLKTIALIIPLNAVFDGL